MWPQFWLTGQFACVMSCVTGKTCFVLLIDVLVPARSDMSNSYIHTYIHACMLYVTVLKFKWRPIHKHEYIHVTVLMVEIPTVSNSRTCMHPYMHACTHSFIHTYTYIHTYMATMASPRPKHLCLGAIFPKREAVCLWQLFTGTNT